MLLLEMDCSINIGGKCCQMGLSFLQGDSTLSNEVGRRMRGVGQRKKVCCFSDVKG